MVKAEVVRRRLERWAAYLQILQRYRAYDSDEFLADPERYGSAERFLQLAIEANSIQASGDRRRKPNSTGNNPIART